ncbi:MULTISPECIES: winged helix-turn-helix domain-containing protein [Nocardia]|uniref:winged helix-turn-helix domain-containing protein n=1 Tax=Nocardia TaxID=1817 RepID=UPI00313BFD2D
MAEKPSNPDSARPVYLRIADELRRRYEPGAKLPSTPELADEWNVARATIRAAIDVLRSEDLVSSWPGRGVYYRAAPERPADSDDSVTRQLDEVMQRLTEVESRLAALESGTRQEG